MNSERSAKKGKFITFEGGEGVGKSTQSRWLANYLAEQGQPALWTREPGGSPGAEAIRALLVNGSDDRWTPYSELFLMVAARVDHWYKTIKPALEQGRWVICDRFIDSTLAYQGYGRGLDLDFLKTLYHQSIGYTYPDRVYVFDLCPTVGLTRAKQRAEQIQLIEDKTLTQENRFEGLDLTFHQRVREGFLSLAQQNPARYLLIDGNQTQEEIQQQLEQDLVKFFNNSVAR